MFSLQNAIKIFFLTARSETFGVLLKKQLWSFLLSELSKMGDWSRNADVQVSDVQFEKTVLYYFV